MSTTKLFSKWASQLPMAGSFRVSVKVKKGKRIAYTYLNCLSQTQFRNWLKNNQNKIIDVVNVTA